MGRLIMAEITGNKTITKIMCQSSRVNRPAFRQNGGKRRAFAPARTNAGAPRRGGPRQDRGRVNMYQAGKAVDAMNMKFQGDRSAFTRKAGRAGNLAANYNGKKFRPVQVISDEERAAILRQCEPALPRKKPGTTRLPCKLLLTS